MILSKPNGSRNRAYTGKSCEAVDLRNDISNGCKNGDKFVIKNNRVNNLRKESLQLSRKIQCTLFGRCSDLELVTLKNSKGSVSCFTSGAKIAPGGNQF